MKTEIYLVRHAQPDLSVRKDNIRPLSAKGREDAYTLKQYFLDKNITAIYASPYKRAYDTVAPIAEAIGLPIIVEDDFRERAIGMWVEDFQAFSTRQWSDFDYRLDNGESLAETQNRSMGALMRVVRDNPGGSVVIGTHGTALSTVLHYYNPDFGYEGFLGMVDKMPYVVYMCFDSTDCTVKSLVCDADRQISEKDLTQE